MKNKKNVLAKLVANDLKTKPYFIETNNWLYVKAIISDFKELMVDIFLSNDEIEVMEYFINLQLNHLAEIATDKQLYECHCFVTEILDYYLVIAREQELYESCQNIHNLVELLSVKISII